MKITATIDYGKAQITQSWELLQNGPEKFLIVSPTKDGPLVIPLEDRFLQNLKPEESADAVYPATLRTSDAFIWKR